MSRTGKTAAYIHVPFYETHCLYCGFYTKAYGPEESARYTDALLRELALWRNSLLHSSVAGFWSIFWMGYIQWSILNAGDFLLLDCLLFQGKYKHSIVIPGTKGV